MGTYETINTSIDNCINILKTPKFSGGSLGEIQNTVLDIANLVNSLNDYVKL